MNVTPMLYCLLLGCLISLLVIPLLLLPGLKRALPRLQHPRDSNETGREALPVVRLGGVALVAAFAGVCLLIYFLRPTNLVENGTISLGIMGTALAMFFVGTWDDVRPIGAGWKLLIQTLLAIGACVHGTHLEPFGSPVEGFVSQLGILNWAIRVLWLVALTNLFGRFDAVNGLAGVVGFAVLSLLAYTSATVALRFPALCAIGMAGAVLGFLVYNLPPARISLGGGGTAFLGFLIANFSIAHPEQPTSKAMILVLLLPFFGMVLAFWPSNPKPSPSNLSNIGLSSRQLPRLGAVRWRSRS